MIEEIRRQFRERPGIPGSELPDYNTCVVLQRRARSSLVISRFSGWASALVGFTLRPNALGGFRRHIYGCHLCAVDGKCGRFVDNAKKFIETGQFGGPGSGRT